MSFKEPIRRRQKKRNQRNKGKGSATPERPSGDPKKDIALYEPTPEERAAVATIKAFLRKEKAPRLKAIESEGKAMLSLDHPNPFYGQALLMKALATNDVDFYHGILLQLSSASLHEGTAEEREANFMLAVIKGIRPRDQLETMLAVQMAAIHSLMINMVSRVSGSFQLPQLEMAERAINKLARTYATQLEALKRYRSTGEQKVTVEHVTVNEGGKAIVGHVTHGGQGDPEKADTTS